MNLNFKDISTSLYIFMYFAAPYTIVVT